MKSVLILYSTVDGHTLAICERICHVLQRHDHAVTLMSLPQGEEFDLRTFDKIILGASIRYGQHRPTVYDFVARHRATLKALPSAFFSVCAVARKPGKDTPSGNPYFRKFVRKAAWQPQLGAAFAGKIDYQRYRFVDRFVIRFIMWLTNGPTDLSSAVEFTDWAKVESFATEFAALKAPMSDA